MKNTLSQQPIKESVLVLDMFMGLFNSQLVCRIDYQVKHIKALMRRTTLELLNKKKDKNTN